MQKIFFLSPLILNEYPWNSSARKMIKPDRECSFKKHLKLLSCLRPEFTHSLRYFTDIYFSLASLQDASNTFGFLIRSIRLITQEFSRLRPNFYATSDCKNINFSQQNFPSLQKYQRTHKKILISHFTFSRRPFQIFPIQISHEIRRRNPCDCAIRVDNLWPNLLFTFTTCSRHPLYPFSWRIPTEQQKIFRWIEKKIIFQRNWVAN